MRKRRNPLKGMAGQMLKMVENSGHMPAVELIYSSVRTKYSYFWKLFAHCKVCYANQSIIVIKVMILLFVSSSLTVTKRNWGDGQSIHKTKT